MLIEAKLPAVPESVPVARQELAPLEPHLSDQSLRNLLLLATELVTNVVRHVRMGDVQLRAELRDDVLRVEVRDQGQGFQPGPAPQQKERDHGWGLHLLQRASSRWGTVHDDGFTVWFELPVQG